MMVNIAELWASERSTVSSAEHPGGVLQALKHDTLKAGFTWI